MNDNTMNVEINYDEIEGTVNCKYSNTDLEMWGITWKNLTQKVVSKEVYVTTNVTNTTISFSASGLQGLLKGTAVHWVLIKH
jgi:hypothetical protein